MELKDAFNELPPPPDLSKIVPDGWERVPTGELRQRGDLFLDKDIWLRVEKFAHVPSLELVIRRKPRPKKVRPLNEVEFNHVIGCVIHGEGVGPWWMVPYPRLVGWREFAQESANARATCHPPGFPNDVRKLYVEEDGE